MTRWSASQTLTRQDYTQLAGFLTLNDPTAVGGIGGGGGSNPRLKPILSTNFSASLEWYFAERGLLSGSVYQMDLNDYYDYGTVTRTYLNNYLTNNGAGNNPSHSLIYSQYLVSIPVNVNGTLKGVTLNYIQPIGNNFGVSFNYTYATGHSSGGTYMYNADGTLANNCCSPLRSEESAMLEGLGMNARSLPAPSPLMSPATTGVNALPERNWPVQFTAM